MTMKCFKATSTKAQRAGLMFSLVLLAMLSFGSRSANAQAGAEASKTSDISVYGGYTYVRADFGPAIYRDNGGIFGADYTRYFKRHIEASAEFRFGYSSGSVLNEKYYLGGVRGGYSFHDRYHPYGDVLFGGGSVNYSNLVVPALPSNSGRVITAGGGLAVDAYKHLQVFADFQTIHYNFGQNLRLVPNGGDYTLTPFNASIGVVFVLPERDNLGTLRR